jgi:hypothetical protein
MDQLTHSLEDLESPTCPNCGTEMSLYRSELVKFVPVTKLHLFNCRACLLVAESETVHEQVWVSSGGLDGHRLRFFAAAD